MRKEIVVCDNCGKEIKNVSDRYKIDRIILKTPNYTDAAGDSDYEQIVSELCPACARKVAEILIKKLGE